MRTSKKILLACVASMVALSTVAVAGALISGSTGSVIRLSPAPASVALDKLQNASSVYAFDEIQGRTLTAAVAVDAVNAGTYTTFPSGSATIPVGTVVDSQMIHSDIPSKNYTARRQGTVTFSSPILGVIASTAKLASSDAALGAPTTTYAGNMQWRGLEGSSENGWSNVADKFIISSDKKTLTFDVKTYVMDEIRVVTSHVNQLVTTITGAPNPVQAGENVAYTVKVTNTGGGTAAGVQVQDSFPGATFVSATAPGACTGTGPVTCSLGNIAAGGFATAVITVTTPNTATTLTNTATAPPGQNPAATATTSVVSPALVTSIADEPPTVTAGLDVQYTLTVTNNGIAPVANVHVIDTLPTGTVLKTAPVTCTGSGPVDCTLGTLAVNEAKDVAIVVTSPSTVPDGGTMTNSAYATPGGATANEPTNVEAPQDGVAKGFVLPGGSITIPSDNPTTVTLPNTGDGAPIEITQGAGTFCDNNPCEGPVTTISPFTGYPDPLNPITAVLTYTFPDTSPTSLLDSSNAYYNGIIYKHVDTDPPGDGTAVPPCTNFGAGVAVPHPCIDARSFAQPTFNNFVVTYTIKYVSGDPSFGRR